MLHGHAVATGMGFGAYLSRAEGWISEDEFLRILNLISAMELSLWHPIMDEVDMIWSSQVKMIQKRGGNLCAPIPKNGLGQCGYLNDLPYDLLKTRLSEYKEICADFPRQGLGVEVHCADVGLEDPSVTAKAHVRSEQLTIAAPAATPTTYQDWIEQAQKSRNANWKLNVSLHEAENTKLPPKFDHVSKNSTPFGKQTAALLASKSKQIAALLASKSKQIAALLASKSKEIPCYLD